MTQTPTRTKNEAPEASRYYVLRTIDAAGNALTETIAVSRRRMVDDPLAQGKKLAAQLQRPPRETVADLATAGRKAVAEIRSTVTRTIDEAVEGGKNAVQHPCQTVDRLLAEGKSRWQQLKADSLKTVGEYSDSGREIIGGIRTDVDLVITELKSAGDTAVKKIDIRQSLRSRFNQRIKKVPQLLNLPDRNALAALNKRLASVVAQVEQLNETNG